MDKLRKLKGKLLATAALILAITTLSAFTSAGSSLGVIGNSIALGEIGNRTTPSLLTVCHATGDPANPYEELTVNSAELNVHREHPNDINPMPANGCPTSSLLTSDGKITICHATGSQNNPYNEITVSVNGLNGHDGHEGDIIPVPQGDCPATLAEIDNRTTTSALTVCHATGNPANPYEELTVNSAELNLHREHPNDINPMPANGCPTSSLLTSDGKITICHGTGSQNNPYNEITVSVNGLNGHDGHEGDIIPEPEEGCPATSAAIDNRTTTLRSIGNRITTFLGAFGNRTTTTPQVNACHATGDLANPYEVITITYDISPVPANGCPPSPVLISDGKVTICHATGSQTNPYNEITVSIIGLNGHGTHEDDVFPSQEGGCPTISGVNGNQTSTTTIKSIGNRITTTLDVIGNYFTTTFGAIGNRTTTTSPLTVCHATDDPANPYQELTVNNAELNAHREHPNDINPVPANGCPASLVFISDSEITICHATGSQNNPYNEITVSVNGLNGHDGHGGDIIPAPEGGCSTNLWTTSGDKITICHATGSQNNPYNEITVSVNGLNGHDGHGGDIIPVPAGGCPGNPQGKKPNNGKP